MPQADSVAVIKPVKKSAQQVEEERQARNNDEANWEYIEVPKLDLFGDPNNGVSINFTKYGPGRHFVNPELAAQIRKQLAIKLAAEMRILQPGQDEKMREIMAKTSMGAPDR